MRARALAIVIVCSGCGAASPGVRPDHCDDVVLGACVASDTGRYEPRVLERDVRLALAYWGAPAELLAGWAIALRSGEVACPTALGSGCTHWDDAVRTIELQVLDPACPETAQLVHEIGHVIHHDPGHGGPWWSWKHEQDATFSIVREPGASPGCARSGYYTTVP